MLLPLPPALTEAWRDLPPMLFQAVLCLGVDDALKELNKAVAKHPDGILYWAQGVMLIRENRWAEAKSPGWQDRVQWDYLRREVEALLQSTRK